MENLLQVLIYTYIFIIGLFMGSFYNVVGIRLPEKKSLMGRSHCPQCDHTLGWFELFPIIGYIALGGRCKICGKKISIKYPIIEAITGVLFLLSYIFFGQNMIEYTLIVVFVSLLSIVTVSDMYYRIVPDSVLLFFLPLVLGLRIFSSAMPWYEGLIGGLLGFGFMYLIALYGEKRFKQEALGGGDIKLYALIGLFLGYRLVFLSLVFAALAGLVYAVIIKNKEKYLPFVPFIYAGTMLAYFLGDYILNYYNSIL